MKRLVKRNLALVIGISLPILMILLLAGSLFIPRLFSQPKYDFIYQTHENIYSGTTFYNYRVESGKLVRSEDNSPTLRYSRAAQLYYYSQKTSTSRPISFDEASHLHLSTATTSPDGYTLKRNNQSSSWFVPGFSAGSDRTSYYLEGNGVTKTITRDYAPEPIFIGWVVP